MSGLYERIARRRASASSTGTPTENGHPPSNGGTAWRPLTQVNEAAAPEPEAPEPTGEPEAAAPGAEAAAPGAEAAAPEAEAAAPEAEAEQPEPIPRATLRSRGRIRRRIRYLRHLRELQIRDLGGFMLELRRFGAERPELLEAKLESTAQTDRELRGLELALHGHAEVREVREPGIGGACRECGAVHGSGDEFCSNCGTRIGRP